MDEEKPQSLDWPNPRADRPKPYERGFTKRLVLAEEFITQNRIDDALSILEGLLELRLQDGAVINNLGIAYRLAGRREDSIAILKHGLSITDADHLLHFNLAVNFDDLGRASEVIVHYQKAIESHSGLLPAYKRLANLLIEQNALNGAIDVLRESLVHTESNASTYYLIDLVEGMQGRWDESSKDL